MNMKEEWLEACKEYKIRSFIEKHISTNRLKRLFAVVCCDHIKHLITDKRSLKALEIAELYADGLTTEEELQIAHQNVVVPDYAAYAVTAADSATNAVYYASVGSAIIIYDCTSAAVAYTVTAVSFYNRLKEQEYQSTILEIMLEHNFEHNWKNDTTTHIAKSIYQNKNWHDMPILADALEDVGCTDSEVLNYCRGEGPFFKGCLILDELLELRK